MFSSRLCLQGAHVALQPGSGAEFFAWKNNVRLCSNEDIVGLVHGRIYSKPGFSLHPAMFLLNQSKTRLCRAIIGRLLPLVRGQLEMLPVDLA
jgi:hypothetical protein